MKLKLDLHPIYADSLKIEQSLLAIIDEACEKRASEIEIIPGKGSGALKKSVLRFLDRRDIRAKYHRIEKDSDNWGRLFVHFKWDRSNPEKPEIVAVSTVDYKCFCCGGVDQYPYEPDHLIEVNILSAKIECPSCGSPNLVTLKQDRRGNVRTTAESGYI